MVMSTVLLLLIMIMLLLLMLMMTVLLLRLLRRRVVGMHRFAGSWIPGKEKEQGIVNVTAELCNPQPDTFRRRLLV